MESRQDKGVTICSKVIPPNLMSFIMKYSPTHATTNFHFTYALWIENHLDSKVCG